MAGIVAEIARKGSDKRALAALAERIARRRPEAIAEVVAGLEEKGTGKYGCEKTLRLLSELQPRLLYPHFETVAGLLDGKNSFLRWGAIRTVANLVAADGEGRFDRVLKKYFAPLRGPELVPAANTIAGAVRIARGRPKLTGRVVREILKVEQAAFLQHGGPSPECRNVAIGQAVEGLDALRALLEGSRQKDAVVEFVTRQLENPRAAVRKKAEGFLKRHAMVGDGHPAIRIRRERPGDRAAVRRINQAAFGRPPAGSSQPQAALGQPQEPDLVDALRRYCPGLLSLVALAAGSPVGHILFSPAVVDSAVGPAGVAGTLSSAASVSFAASVQGMGLAPMAVLPEYQRRGIGSRLVRRGLEILRRAGTPFVIVLGHPEYYPRFGFQRASLHGLRCQWEGVPDEAFMVLVLDQARLRGVSGTARYRPEFDAAM